MHVRDLPEFGAVAPDLASWVDEVVAWEGAPERHPVYAPRAAIPDAVWDSARSSPKTGPAMRGVGDAGPLVWLDARSLEHVDIDRIAELLDEIEAGVAASAVNS